MPDSHDPEMQNKDRKAMSTANLVRFSEMGFIIPAGVIVGLLLGKLMDHWLGTKWIYIAGVIFGAVIGFIQLIRMALSMEKQ